MPYDAYLLDLMRDTLEKRLGIIERKMFGGFCWMLNGNMLCGVEVGRFMFRVGKDLEPEALLKPGASPMDITGRPMRGIIWVDADEAIEAGLENWVDFACQFVGGLKPK